MNERNKQQTIDDQLLMSAAKSTLLESVENLDAETLDRLAAIRKFAIASSVKQKPDAWRINNWLLPAGGFITAAVLVVAVLLWSSASETELAPMAVLEDIRILTDSENLEFYQELEFYQWLAINEQTVS